MSRRKSWPLPDPKFQAGYCDDCQKVAHLTKRAAKRAARHYSRKLSTYRCRVNDQFWHNGHLAPGVKEGRITRGELYFKEGLG